MVNDSLSWIPTALDVQLASISDHDLTISGVILAILGILVTLYIGVPYVKKLNIKNKKDLDQAMEANAQATAQAIAQAEARIERCIEEHIPIDNQDRQAGPFCKGFSEDIRQLQNSASNYDQGLSKVARGDFNGADIEFSATIDQQLPMLAKYYFQRGNSRFFQKRFKDSCADYSESLKIAPQHAEAWSNKGVSLSMLGRHEEAIEAYDQALKININDQYAWSNKGASLGKLGRLEEASKAIERAKKLGMKT